MRCRLRIVSCSPQVAPVFQERNHYNESPSTLRVLQYDLALDVDFTAETFRGVVAISGWSAGESVELDCADLSITSVQQGEESIPYQFEKQRNKLVLHPRRPAPEPIKIAFSGKAANDIQTGLFVSRSGTRKALTTQLEPEGCRRLFPCYDVPSRKAVFRVRVAASEDLTVISNTQGDARRLPNGGREWTFRPTPPMSTYLLYIGLGPFEEMESFEDRVRVIVATLPGAGHPAENTLTVARTALRAFGEYYALPYPLDKLHVVTVPDFWGGMENWGAILGGEDLLLFDETTSPTASRFAQDATVHEVAHQWFGDLVTLENWDDIWLNESFATFAVPRIQERAHLREDAWGEFVIRTRLGDNIDSLRSTHSVKPPNIAPAEIMAYADEITYHKGSRLLRMIEAYLGEEVFRKGVSAYLQRHQFRNARSDDFWQALEELSGRSVVSVMRTWVDRPGLPCLRARRDGSRLELEQRRFTYLPLEAPEPPWPIPLVMKQGTTPKSILFDSPTLTLPVIPGEPLRINPQRTGFYRVFLDREMRRAALEGAMSATPLDRWGMVHDSEAFLLSGDYSLEEYLETIRAVSSASDYVTIEEVAESLDWLFPFLWDEPRFCEAARSVYQLQLERLSRVAHTGEAQSNGILREWLSMGRVRVDPEFAHSLAARFDDIDREEASFRSAIALAFARYGPPDAFARLLVRARGSDADAASQACFAFEALPTPALLAQALAEGLKPGIRLVHLRFLSVAVASNPNGRLSTWEWLTRNLRDLERRFQGSGGLPILLSQIIPMVGLGREAEVESFFLREAFPESAPGIQKGLEWLKIVSRLRARTNR